ncbi:MAG: 50S ribosomal protein L30 [Proteobacteria bacterium]|nr:50S ribosomal protein L30 [Pseudomonadota bacterium]
MATSKTTEKPAEKAKPKVAKAPAAEKTSAKKAAAPKAAAKAPKGVAKYLTGLTKEPIGGEIKVTQMVGSIARRHDQEATLIGLGLNKRHRSRVLKDTPEVRGMIYKVRHLLKVEKVS